MSSPKIKVSQMSTASSVGPTDTWMVVQNGVNKKISTTDLLKNLNSFDSIRFNPSQFAVNTSFASKNDANTIFVHGTQDRVGFGTSTPASKVHVNGNLQVGSDTTEGIVVQSSESINAVDGTTVNPISTIRASSLVSCASGISGKFSLPSGHNGQIKYFVVSTLSGGNTAIVTCVGLNFNTITFNAVGNSITLQYFTSLSKWCVMNIYGAGLSTV